LPQRPDLPERKFGKGHRAFMFVEHFDPVPKRRTASFASRTNQ
jgi:hypothetical protein